MKYHSPRIYTRTGDKGTTRLGDGTATHKDELRIEAYGTVDELNSVIGLILTHSLPTEIQHCLISIQHDLFDLGEELSLAQQQAVALIASTQIDRLEQDLDKFNAALPPLTEFILPGGSVVAAMCHLARTICRRTERRIVSLTHIENINPDSLVYLNRLSDLLFVMARILNKEEGIHEILWERTRN